ncbi:glycosyltransferase [Akkermansiaceae bacterium]|nr:glycosyltransferase [Akkermansiaceae bacterium]
MLHLNLIARTNGVGLDRDVDLIHQVATAAGHKVTISHCREISLFSQWLGRKNIFDTNIFLERIFPRWLGSAKTNILIPNQERFPHRHLPRLKKIDHVFCKSKHALAVFSQHHPSCLYTGFTSANLDQPAVPRRSRGILHLAGRSTLKGTATVLALWKKRPDWPVLTLLQHKDNAPEEVPQNVKLITNYLSQEDIVTLINEHPIHLCPSLSEGWGHYIVEAMSCGATVITTDGPPMNDLIQPDRGILVNAPENEPRHLGTNFKVAPDALESAINQALSLSDKNRTSIADHARSWTRENHRQFAERFTQALSKL